MMTRWTHAICVKCWNEREPHRPVRFDAVNGETEECCFCGQLTVSGIYNRSDPKSTPCLGVNGSIHEED